jgi:3-hydroxybutyryl-CoA dehydratase
MSENTIMDVNKLTPGMDLPEIEKIITQENINRYAEVSRDFNPIHIDEDFAKKTPLGGTIAHGMLILAYVSQMMTMAFGQDWLTGGKLSVRFKAPARPGDTVNITGKILKIEKREEQCVINCDLLCNNQSGDAIIIGETEVRIKQ